MEGKEVFGGIVDWPGDQEGVCWPKPESLAGGSRGQLLGPSSSGFLLKPLTCLQLLLNLSCLTASGPNLFSPHSSGLPASTQENGEASANVVVKMTDSFTEQADQVIPGKHAGCGGGEPWGEAARGVFSFFQMLFS